eukprot:Skav225339  [mRNA]  locus=scaffold748:396471:397007:- [translate_table: standard]
MQRQVQGSLRPHWNAGDCNCCYRAVARQLPQGEEVAHLALRQQSVDNALKPERWFHYAPFLTEDDPYAELSHWAERMRQNRRWADLLSCRTLADFLQRPVLIWRTMSPDQPPTCFVPANFHQCPPATPIYLRLEEDIPGTPGSAYSIKIASWPCRQTLANPNLHRQEAYVCREARAHR